jgi:hypothetical protein
MHVKHHLKIGQLQQLQLTPVTPVTTTGQTGAQHMNRASTLTGQTYDLERSDWWTPKPRNGSQPPENLLNYPASHFKLKLLPLVGNA